jgi:hypothetical protein
MSWTGRPSAVEHPHLAAWLKANDKPLAIAIEAGKRPRYFNPLVSKKTENGAAGMVSALLASVQKSRQGQRNLRLAFALAAYHRDHGRYPAKLEALATKYLAAVPDDLFSGKPLSYQPDGNG